MGILLFWIDFIISVILLYNILFCIYVKGKSFKEEYSTKYEKTDYDKRLKHPLWVIILFTTILFIPGLNLVVYIVYLSAMLLNEYGDKYNKYYSKSIFTKKF